MIIKDKNINANIVAEASTSRGNKDSSEAVVADVTPDVTGVSAISAPTVATGTRKGGSSRVVSGGSAAVAGAQGPARALGVESGLSGVAVIAGPSGGCSAEGALPLRTQPTASPMLSQRQDTKEKRNTRSQNK